MVRSYWRSHAGREWDCMNGKIPNHVKEELAAIMVRDDGRTTMEYVGGQM